MQITNLTRKTILATQAQRADTFRSRMVGLLKHSSLADGEALIITQCQSIHMFGMRFPIDAIFYDKNLKVVGLVQTIQPNSLSPIFWRATCVIEAPVGTIVRTRTAVGDHLQINA